MAATLRAGLSNPEEHLDRVAFVGALAAAVGVEVAARFERICVNGATGVRFFVLSI